MNSEPAISVYFVNVVLLIILLDFNIEQCLETAVRGFSRAGWPCYFEEVTDSNLFRLKATDGQEHSAGKNMAVWQSF